MARRTTHARSTSRVPARTVRPANTERTQRGSVAVEAALTLTLLLTPLLLGIVKYGDYFWKAQKVDVLAPSVPTGTVVGSFDCQSLKSAVAAAVVAAVEDLDPGLAGLDAGDVAVTVTEILPDVGVTVEVSIDVAATGGLASLIDLPGGGSLVTDFSQRLSDVTLTTGVCR